MTKAAQSRNQAKQTMIHEEFVWFLTNAQWVVRFFTVMTLCKTACRQAPLKGVAAMSSLAPRRPPKVLYQGYATLSQHLFTKRPAHIVRGQWWWILPHAHLNTEYDCRFCLLHMLVMPYGHQCCTGWPERCVSDVRQFASDCPSIDDLLSSFALAPNSTTAVYALKLSGDHAQEGRRDMESRSGYSSTSFQRRGPNMIRRRLAGRPVIWLTPIMIPFS